MCQRHPPNNYIIGDFESKLYLMLPLSLGAKSSVGISGTIKTAILVPAESSQFNNLDESLAKVVLLYFLQFRAQITVF